MLKNFKIIAVFLSILTVVFMSIFASVILYLKIFGTKIAAKIKTNFFGGRCKKKTVLIVLGVFLFLWGLFCC